MFSIRIRVPLFDFRSKGTPAQGPMAEWMVMSIRARGQPSTQREPEQNDAGLMVRLSVPVNTGPVRLRPQTTSHCPDSLAAAPGRRDERRGARALHRQATDRRTVADGWQ